MRRASSIIVRAHCSSVCSTFFIETLLVASFIVIGHAALYCTEDRDSYVTLGETIDIAVCAFCSDSQAGIQWTLDRPSYTRKIEFSYTCVDGQDNGQRITSKGDACFLEEIYLTRIPADVESVNTWYMVGRNLSSNTTCTFQVEIFHYQISIGIIHTIQRSCTIKDSAVCNADPESCRLPGNYSIGEDNKTCVRQCADGYLLESLPGLSDSQSCQDKNECMDPDERSCTEIEHSVCINQLGNYSCICEEGFHQEGPNCNANPPSIVSHPTTIKDLSLGDNITFSIIATSTFDLTYQWYEDGLQLSDDDKLHGTNLSTLKVFDVGMEHEGVYWCNVSTPFGSSAVTNRTGLIINKLTIITDLQEELNITQGEDAIFMVNATGLGHLKYQWYKNDTALHESSKYTGTDTSVLMIMDAQREDEDYYYSIVSSEFDEEAISRVAKLITLFPVSPETTISTQTEISMGSQTPGIQQEKINLLIILLSVLGITMVTVLIVIVSSVTGLSKRQKKNRHKFHLQLSKKDDFNSKFIPPIDISKRNFPSPADLLSLQSKLFAINSFPQDNNTSSEDRHSNDYDLDDSLHFESEGEDMCSNYRTSTRITEANNETTNEDDEIEVKLDNGGTRPLEHLRENQSLCEDGGVTSGLPNQPDSGQSVIGENTLDMGCSQAVGDSGDALYHQHLDTDHDYVASTCDVPNNSTDNNTDQSVGEHQDVACSMNGEQLGWLEVPIITSFSQRSTSQTSGILDTGLTGPSTDYPWPEVKNLDHTDDFSLEDIREDSKDIVHVSSPIATQQNLIHDPDYIYM